MVDELLSDEEEEKAWGQFNLQLNGVFTPFKMYGQDIYVAGAKEEIMALAYQLHWRLSGLDIPIQLSEEAVQRWQSQ